MDRFGREMTLGIQMTVALKPKTVSIGDDVLVERIRRGDGNAFQTLYLRHFEYLEAFLIRLFGGTEDIEDVLQETFLTAVEHINELKNAEKIRGWLTAIAVNCAKRYMSKSWKDRQVKKIWPDEAPQTENQTEHVSLKEAYDALGRLSPKLRIPWMLHRIEELTLLEVAAIYGASRSTVKRRIAAAEARLKRLLNVD